MWLRLIKDDKNNISIKFVVSEDGSEKLYDFKYEGLIRYLCKKNILDDSDFIGDISEKEKMKINEMIAQINASIERDS